MGARDLLEALAVAGLAVTTEGDRLVVTPAGRLTDELRQAIRALKPDLLAELRPKPEPVPVPVPAPYPLELQQGHQLIDDLAPEAVPELEEPGPRAVDQAEFERWDELWDACPIDEADTLRGRRLRRLAGFVMDEATAKRLMARLDSRDAGADDRRSCVECSHWTGRTCLQWRRGRSDTNAGMPVDVLHRCPAFGLAKGLEL
jgi:hypothetical protein